MSESPNVVLFSGGRTSGYMLRRLLDSTDMYSNFHRDRFDKPLLPKWIVIFCNTGKERTETLDFVHEVETQWNVPVVWLEYRRVLASTIRSGIFPTKKRNQNLEKDAAAGNHTHWFKQVNYETASRNGEPFDKLISWASVLPNPTARICSVQLKMRTAMRYLFSRGVDHYSPHIGIRTDESHRATEILASCGSFESPVFPLIDMGVSEKDVLSFWKSQPFDLQLDSYEGNCDLCFLKAKHKLVRIIKENPGVEKWWISKELEKSKTCSEGAVFRRGRSYETLKAIAFGRQQQDLFELGDADIACSCAEKSFDCSIPD